MQAAILAAGLGTRLRPLTHTVPKALIPVLNRPLLGILMSQLRQAGAHKVAVNTHHLADRVEEFFDSNPPWGLEVVLRPEPEILGTGGGLRSLAGALDDAPFLALNADILTDLDLAQIFRKSRPEALATLVLHDCPRHNHVWIDQKGRVTGIGESPPNVSGPPLAYTGIQVVNPRMLGWLPPEGPADLVAAWRQIIAQGEDLAACVVSGHFWQDVGSPEAYLAVHQKLLSGAGPGLAGFFPRLTDPLIGPGARLETGVTCAGGVSLGREVRVGQGTWLKNTVVWDEALIGPGLTLENCIVARGAQVTVSAQDKIIV